MDPYIDFRSMFARFNTVLMGRKTYEAAKRQGGGGAMPGTPAYVFSHTLRQSECKGAIVSDRPAETVAAIKAKAGKDLWLFGGGALFQSLLGLGLVDAVEVAVIPGRHPAAAAARASREADADESTRSTRRPGR
jgi:dihydrofolate reductase